MSDVLVVAQKKTFTKGKIIFKQGDSGTEMYIIEKGRVRLALDTDDKGVVPLGELGPKNFFGEMALFGDKKRTATATALEDTKVIVINGQVMKSQLAKLPQWFVIMFKTLIERLKETDEKFIHGRSNKQKNE